MNVSLILGRYSEAGAHVPLIRARVWFDPRYRYGNTPTMRRSISVWHVSWHDGFGGTHTADTPNPFVFRSTLGRVDWFEIDGFAGLTAGPSVV
jgi:hypothetical protein